MFPVYVCTQFSTIEVFTDELSMIGEVGEDLKEQLKRKPENCTKVKRVSGGAGPVTWHPLPLVWILVLLCCTTGVWGTTAIRPCSSLGDIVISGGCAKEFEGKGLSTGRPPWQASTFWSRPRFQNRGSNQHDNPPILTAPNVPFKASKKMITSHGYPDYLWEKFPAWDLEEGFRSYFPPTI